MRILLSNDDGFQADGIQALKYVLSNLGHDIYLIAPERNRSACSSSLTVRKALFPIEVAPQTWKVPDGTPADCIHLAMRGILDFEPDAVISGINDAPNLGDDIIYSGTVAAALEARYIKGPKLAVSLNFGQRFQQAATATAELLHYLNRQPQHPILNINFPDLPSSAIKGWKSCRLGKRQPPTRMINESNMHGKTAFRIGPAGEPLLDKGNTDFNAIKDGFVSVSPIHIDMTSNTDLQFTQQFLPSKKFTV